MSPVRFAIIGSGSIAGKHAQAIASVPGAELVAVWGRDISRGQAFADQYGAEFTTDLSGLVARADIDAATIATPSGFHELPALEFMQVGKAVLCEKPLEITLKKINNMLEVSHAHRAPLACILQRRLSAGAQAMKRAVEQGRFGQLTLCGAYLKWWRDQAYYDTVAWRGTREWDGGGAMMNQGIHAVDLLQWLVGMPEMVFAFGGQLAHERIEVEDTMVVSLKFPNGGLGVIEAATSCKPGSAMRIELCGDKGSAVLEDDVITRWQFDDERTEDESIRKMRTSLMGGGAGDPMAITTEGHRLLVEDFVSAIREQRPPMIPGVEAVNAVRLILTCYQSAAEGRIVRVSDVR